MFSGGKCPPPAKHCWRKTTTNAPVVAAGSVGKQPPLSEADVLTGIRAALIRGRRLFKRLISQRQNYFKSIFHSLQALT